MGEAGRLEDRPRLARRRIEQVEARIGIGLQNAGIASRWGPARPRAIGCEGAGVSAMLSQIRQDTLLAHMLDHLPVARHAFERLADGPWLWCQGPRPHFAASALSWLRAFRRARFPG